MPMPDICVSPPRVLGLQKSVLAKQMKCVYGTRDDGMMWEETYRAALEDIVFTAGRTSPCCFFHKDRSIHLVAHGDDMTAMGLRADLDCYEERPGQSFELKIRGRIGENTELKSMCLLNRVVILTDKRLLYKSDSFTSQSRRR